MGADIPWGFQDPAFSRDTNLVPADYDGDGATDLACVDPHGPDGMEWTILASDSATTTQTEYTPTSLQGSTELWAASNAGDGNTASCWSSNGHATAANTEWLAYWFDDFYEINCIKVLPRTVGASAVAFPKDFNVYYSDGAQWVHVGTYTNYPTPPANTWVRIALPYAVEANGIGIIGTTLGQDDAGNYIFQMAEARGSYEPGYEAWPVTAAVASSAIWPVANAIDGDPGSAWCSNWNPGPIATEWIAYWFDGFHPVNTVRIIPRYIGNEAYCFPIDFVIYYSFGGQWNVAGTFTEMVNPNEGKPVSFALPEGIVANGIHVVATLLGEDPGGGNYLQLAEVGAGMTWPAKGPSGIPRGWDWPDTGPQYTPVVEDYTGDGVANRAIVGPDYGGGSRWYVMDAPAIPWGWQWGGMGNQFHAIPGDYTGDGVAERGIVDPDVDNTGARWYVLGAPGIPWGWQCAIPYN